MVSTKTIDSFLERIAKDDSKQSVTNFRMSVPLMEGDYQFYKGIKQWQHVYPAAEFGKDESDNLVFKKSNGLLMLHFTNLTTDQDMEAARKAARLLPMTFAAITGADGRSLIVLVSICDEEGSRTALSACLRTGQAALSFSATGRTQGRKANHESQFHAHPRSITLLQQQSGGDAHLQKQADNDRCS